MFTGVPGFWPNGHMWGGWIKGEASQWKTVYSQDAMFFPGFFVMGRKESPKDRSFGSFFPNCGAERVFLCLTHFAISLHVWSRKSSDLVTPSWRGATEEDHAKRPKDPTPRLFGLHWKANIRNTEKTLKRILKHWKRYYFRKYFENLWKNNLQ